MLMINRVELAVLDQSKKVRELKCRDPLRLQEDFEAANKINDIGNMRKNVIRHHMVREMSGCRQRPGGVSTEKHDFRWHATRDSNLGNIACRLDTEDRDITRHEILQQVTVIARHLDNLMPWAELKAILHSNHISFRVLKPACRKA